MARGLDPRQKAELVDFLERLYRLGGYETQAQWAREAQYHTVNLSNALNRAKPDGLDGYTLLKLIEATARRQESTASAVARLAAEAEREEETHRRLAAVEDGLTELASEIHRALVYSAAPESVPSQRETWQGGHEG